MKKTLTLIFFASLISISLKAQPNYNLVFYSEDGEPFYLEVNGVQQNNFAETNVRLEGLSADVVKVKIAFENSALGEFTKSIYAPATPEEATYRIMRTNKGKWTARYFSSAPIPQPERQLASAPPAQRVVTTAAPVQAIAVTQVQTAPVSQVQHTSTTTTTTATSSAAPATGANVSFNMGNGSFGMNVNINEAEMTSTSSSVTTSTTVSSSSSSYSTSTSTAPDTTVTVVEEAPSHYVMEGYNGPMGCPWPMDEVDFEEAMQSIASKDFEESKFQIAKQVIGANCIFADQVRDIMKLFDFEDTRIDFAKFAYPYTFDQGNYFKVHDAFEFEMSINELNESLGIGY